MNFLLTTVKGYGLVQDGELSMIREADFYGLTWNDDDVFWSWNPAHIHNSVIESQQCGELSLLPVRGVHQILWAQDRLWITDTSRDRVVWWDGEQDGHFQLHHNDQADNLHLNSLWEWDGRVVVVVSGLSGQGGLAKSITGDLVIELGPHFYHNVYIENDFLYGCYKDKAQRSGLFRKRLVDGPVEELPFAPGSFARGIARNDEMFLVGCSESQPREQRFEGGSQVMVISDEFEIVDTIRLEDTGQIRDVRLLEGDLAHNGLSFPGGIEAVIDTIPDILEDS